MQIEDAVGDWQGELDPETVEVPVVPDGVSNRRGDFGEVRDERVPLGDARTVAGEDLPVMRC